MRIRFLHTESFRLAAIYTAVFALCIGIIGISVLAVVDKAMREQVIAHAQADIATINDGYVHEGMHEAVEVSRQRMAAVGHSDFLLLQRDNRAIVGNLPAMAPRIGSIEIPSPVMPGHVILGVGARLDTGLYVFSGTDPAFVTAVRERILGLLVWLFAGALLLAALSGALVSRSFVARMDAIARTCRAIMAGTCATAFPSVAARTNWTGSQPPSTPCSTASPR